MRTTSAFKPPAIQFGLMVLMELVTICAILFAVSAATGMMSSIFLALMALGLAIRSGPFALMMFAVALYGADTPLSTTHDDGLLRQLTVILISVLLCTWYRRRSRD